MLVLILLFCPFQARPSPSLLFFRPSTASSTLGSSLPSTRTCHRYCGASVPAASTCAGGPGLTKPSGAQTATRTSDSRCSRRQRQTTRQLPTSLPSRRVTLSPCARVVTAANCVRRRGPAVCIGEGPALVLLCAGGQRNLRKEGGMEIAQQLKMCRGKRSVCMRRRKRGRDWLCAVGDRLSCYANEARGSENYWIWKRVNSYRENPAVCVRWRGLANCSGRGSIFVLFKDDCEIGK